MSRKPFFLAALLMAALLLAAKFIPSMGSDSKATEMTPFMSAMPAVNKGWVAAPGRVEPISEELRLGFDISGILKDVFVDEGQNITRGQVLAELFGEEYKQKLESTRALVQARQAEAEKTLTGARKEEKLESQAALMLAEAVMSNALVEFKRRASLLEKNLIAKETVDRAQTEYNTAKATFEMRRQQYLVTADRSRKEDVAIALANLEHARAQEREAMSYVDKTVLRAPIDGMVLKIHRRKGEAVSEFFESGVLTVGDMSGLRLRADVDERDIALVRVGQKAYATADAFGERKFPGRVERVGSMLGRKNLRTDEPTERVDTKILEVLISFEDSPPLVPGLRMDTYIDVSTAGLPPDPQAAGKEAPAAPAPETAGQETPDAGR